MRAGNQCGNARNLVGNGKKMGEKDGDAGNQRGKCISVEMT